VLIVCVSIIISQSTASILINSLTTSPSQEAVRPIDESCVAHAHNGICQFYTCFEERHPCSTPNYALDYGWRFCSRFDTHFSRLNLAGQKWLNGTRKCAMEHLLSFYQEESIVCSEVAAEMKDSHASCEVENGLCSGRMLTDNKRVFTDVYTINRHSVTQFLHSIKHCTASKLRQVSSWFRETIGHIPILPAIREMRDSIIEIGSDIMSEVRRIGGS